MDPGGFSVLKLKLASKNRGPLQRLRIAPCFRYVCGRQDHCRCASPSADAVARRDAREFFAFRETVQQFVPAAALRQFPQTSSGVPARSIKRRYSLRTKASLLGTFRFISSTSISCQCRFSYDTQADNGAYSYVMCSVRSFFLHIFPYSSYSYS